MKRIIKILGFLLLLIGVYLTILFVFFCFNPIGLSFQTSFKVKNASDRTIFITPVGIADTGVRRVLPITITKIPIIPALNRSDFKLRPNKTLTIAYNWDDITFTEIAVKDESGGWRQFSVLEEERNACCSPNASEIYIINGFDKLEPIAPEVQTAALHDSVNPNAFSVYILLSGPVFIVFGRRLMISRKQDIKKHRP